MGFTETFAGVAVRSIGDASPWYERLFGRPPDMLPNDIEAAWQVTPGGWVYVVEDAERAGYSLLTLLVDDLDERLTSAGVDAASIDVVGGGTRTAVFTDPDGNRIQLGQPPATA